MKIRPAPVLALIATVIGLTGPSAAQTARHTQPESMSPSRPAGPALTFNAAYTADLWGVARGGLDRGIRYLDNLDLTLTIDAERALGWQGATLFGYVLYNNGQSLSGDLVGDLQTASNIETGVHAVRLYEAWVEQRFDGERGSVKLGLYDLNSEFDTTESGALFLNSSHGIGPDFSQAGENGPSIFPVTSLALRLDYRLSDTLLVRVAALDGVPGNPERPRRTAIKLGRGDGALLVAELDYRNGVNKLAVGSWHYNGSFQPIDPDRSPQRTNSGAYALVERRLTVEPAGPDQGLVGWLRAGVADGALNPIAAYLGGGLTYTGPFAGRDEDRVGVAFAIAKLSAASRRLQGSPSREVALELTYRAPLTRLLTLQPDVQYILRPAAAPAARDALLIGLRAELSFGPR